MTIFCWHPDLFHYNGHKLSPQFQVAFLLYSSIFLNPHYSRLQFYTMGTSDKNWLNPKWVLNVVAFLRTFCLLVLNWPIYYGFSPHDSASLLSHYLIRKLSYLDSYLAPMCDRGDCMVFFLTSLNQLPTYYCSSSRQWQNLLWFFISLSNSFFIA